LELDIIKCFRSTDKIIGRFESINDRGRFSGPIGFLYFYRDVESTRLGERQPWSDQSGRP
jgi:hypothetical protein